MPQRLCALGIMTKAPRAGQVKTRLQPPLSPDEAAALNICFLRDTAAAIAEVPADSARGLGIYTPIGAERDYETILPNDFLLIPQRGHDFGERLLFAVEDLLRCGFESVCLIDSDSPTVPTENFARAARLLHEPGDRVVLGPSDDGGYYLIGLKQAHRAVFTGIDWSTERVFAQTVDRALQAAIQTELLPNAYDVDDAATLTRLCEELLGHNASRAPATREFLAQIVAREGRARIWPP